ncbi:MAG: hypothetical protein ACK6CT_01105 [Planctomycetia bacterium]
MRNERGRDRQDGQAAAGRPRPKQFAIGCCLLFVASFAIAQQAREVRRARPPAQWDKAATATFYDDAFATLVGPRPAFTPAPGQGRSADPGADVPQATAFKWSTIVSSDALVDEIKQARATAKGAVAKVSDFKAGGYRKVRVAFGSAAAAFAVIAAYDKDARWKSDAAAARDLLARAGTNCKVGTDQSFNEAKDRVADLDTLIEGSNLTSKPDRDDDFVWSQVAERSALMLRLEEAEGLAVTAAASRSDFVRLAERLGNEAEMTAVIAELIQQRNYEDHEDAEYRGHAAAMRAAAAEIRAAVETKNHEAVVRAVGNLKTSFDACHADYRG